jgi:hypothetical protein
METNIKKIIPPKRSVLISIFNKEDIPSLGRSTNTWAANIKVTKRGVLKLLTGLNPNNATGPNELSTKFLKEMAHPVIPALTKIFQGSTDQGHTPKDWRSANISSMISKKWDKSKPSNYRPVSLTSVCCKVVEHIIYSHVMNFFEEHGRLPAWV